MHTNTSDKGKFNPCFFLPLLSMQCHKAGPSLRCWEGGSVCQEGRVLGLQLGPCSVLVWVADTGVMFGKHRLGSAGQAHHSLITESSCPNKQSPLESVLHVLALLSSPFKKMCSLISYFPILWSELKGVSGKVTTVYRTLVLAASRIFLSYLVPFILTTELKYVKWTHAAVRLLQAAGFTNSWLRCQQVIVSRPTAPK